MGRGALLQEGSHTAMNQGEPSFSLLVSQGGQNSSGNGRLNSVHVLRGVVQENQLRFPVCQGQALGTSWCEGLVL